MVVSPVSRVLGERNDDKRQAVAVGPARLLTGAHSVIGRDGSHRTIGYSFYSLFQEFGTIHHAAQPFARPAFDETAKTSLGIIGKAAWRELAGRGIGRSHSSRGPISGGEGGSTL